MISHTKLNYTMLNKYTVWNIYWKTLGIPEQAIYHHSMDKYIEDIYNTEKDNFLVITT